MTEKGNSLHGKKVGILKKIDRAKGVVIRHFVALAVTALIFLPLSLFAQTLADRFQHIVDTTFAAHPAATGISVCCITGDNKVWTYAVGVSDKLAQTKLNADQPVLVASNTKTYVAATIMKLSEQKKLNISEAINKYLPRNTLDKLETKGYKTGEINVAHLLSHTSGIDDFGNDEYFDFVNTHRQYNWTRDEQISRAMEVGTILGQPGDTFSYADVNYLLLTEIIENLTGKPFYTAIRDMMLYKELGLNSTWFMKLETKPAQTGSLAHQYWNKYPWDAYDFDPSWDLYGGGGIATTPADMALFFKSLFEGEIIKDTAVLAKMYAPAPGKAKTNYCLGLRKLALEDLTAYYHAGFWGTDAIYYPELKTAISIVILERDERKVSAPMSEAMARAIKEAKE